MIVMQSREGRRLAGNIGGGADLITSLKDVCRNHGVGTAEVRGIGYLARARLSYYSVETGTFVPDEEGIGAAQIVSLLGNISKADEGLSVHLQVLLRTGPHDAPVLRSGRLEAAETIDFEFFMVALDDFAFVRANVDEGIASWTQIATDAHTVAPGAEADRPDFLPGRLGRGAPDEHEVQEGDIIEHPKLGRCTVQDLPDDHRASVKLESGRTVELHLGLVHLVRVQVQPTGRQRFRAKVRRRT